MNTRFSKLIKDVLAGLTTSFAAIALGAAFGVESGRGAISGMIAAGVIPIITSLFGGTRIQASGPTAPMTAVAVILVSYAYQELSYTGNPAGFITLTMIMMMIIMIVAGVFRLGSLIKYVPSVVVLGFMNGIALSIWWGQISKIFGIGSVDQIGGVLILNIGFAVLTFLLILFFPSILALLKIPERFRIFIPGTLLTIIITTGLFVFSKLELQTVELGENINSFQDFGSMLISYLPTTTLFTPEILLKALSFALQLSLLCYLDSLLTSLVIDKMNGEKTEKNRELIAQGLANGLSGLLGGIPGAQATIRSVILIKEGAQTRLAGVLVGVFALVAALLLKDYLSLVASAIFVGVLFKAGLDVFEKQFFIDFFKQRNWQNRNGLIQLLLIVSTTLITVVWDLNIAVIFGTITYFILARLINLKDVDSEEETAIGNEA